MEQHTLKISDGFLSDNGTEYLSLTATYHTGGKLNQFGTNVIWIFHGLTANSNPQDWWPDMVGEGKTFDTSCNFVICVNMLGSCYGTSYVEKESFVPCDQAFPRFTVSDQVRFFQQVASTIGIKTIDLLVGASIGGFIAQEWAISDPLFIKKLALIATSFQVSPWAAAFNEAQRMALFTDSTFGTNTKEAGRNGLMTARAIAMLSYRGYTAFSKTQGGRPANQPHLHNAATYQRYQGKKLADRFSAEAYLNIINTFDSFDITKNRGSHEHALDLILAKTLVIGYSSDLLFPLSEQYQLASMIRNSTIRIIEADFGHDSFLLEGVQISKYIKECF